MKPRRRFGAGAAGISLLLLTAPTTTLSAAPAPAAPAHEVTALAGSAPVVVDLVPATTTTTAPPPAYVCPVAGDVAFVDSWGFRRSGGRRHQGVDMLAATGTPVVAPAAGTVSFRSNRVGGLSFHLLGDDGTYYYGTHLSAYGADGWVPAGTTVGYVGDTGNARGTPHLHFEVHPGGEGSAAANPYPMVALLCDEAAAA